MSNTNAHKQNKRSTKPGDTTASIIARRRASLTAVVILSLLLAGAAVTDNFDIKVQSEGPQGSATVTVTGEHDKFPVYQIIVVRPEAENSGQTVVYQSDPRQTGNTAINHIGKETPKARAGSFLNEHVAMIGISAYCRDDHRDVETAEIPACHGTRGIVVNAADCRVAA